MKNKEWEKERQLLYNCVESDDEMCDTLVKHLWSMIEAIVRKVFIRKGAPLIKEDLMDARQDVLTRLFQNDKKLLRDFNPDLGPKISHWIMMIANDTTLNYLNKEKKGITFKITESSISKLKREGVPINIIGPLKNLVNRNYMKRELFVEDVRKAIGEDEATAYEWPILKYAQKGIPRPIWQKTGNSADDLPDPDRNIIDKIVLKNLIKRLSPTERSILKKHFEGYSSREIGIAINKKEGAVNTILFRIRQKLKDDKNCS